jgi:hypothetical protein
MPLPKSNGPGALTRKEFGYTAPSSEQLLEELEYITSEMGGNLSVLNCSDAFKTWMKIEIVYDKKEKEK